MHMICLATGPRQAQWQDFEANAIGLGSLKTLKDMSRDVWTAHAMVLLLGHSLYTLYWLHIHFSLWVWTSSDHFPLPGLDALTS